MENKEEVKELINYCVHTYDCILSRLEAGEPTEDGGYRQKFAGKWYQSRPIDETPKCNCGLDELIDKIETYKPLSPSPDINEKAKDLLEKFTKKIDEPEYKATVVYRSDFPKLASEITGMVELITNELQTCKEVNKNLLEANQTISEEKNKLSDDLDFAKRTLSLEIQNNRNKDQQIKDIDNFMNEQFALKNQTISSLTSKLKEAVEEVKRLKGENEEIFKDLPMYIKGEGSLQFKWYELEYCWRFGYKRDYTAWNEWGVHLEIHTNLDITEAVRQLKIKIQDLTP